MSDGDESGVRPEEVSALILAAGKGKRMWGGGSKAFVKAGAATLIERVVALVRPYASEIIVGLPREDIDKGCRLLGGPQVTVAAGGPTRQETVANLLARAARSLVLIHEVARPFAPPALFAKVLSAGKEHGAATLYLPASRRDSVALKAGDSLGAPLARGQVITLQTPQVYRRDILVDAQRLGNERGWIEASTAGLVVRTGHRVHLVRGTPDNIKLTYPEDWEAAVARLSK